MSTMHRVLLFVLPLSFLVMWMLIRQYTSPEKNYPRVYILSAPEWDNVQPPAFNKSVLDSLLRHIDAEVVVANFAYRRYPSMYHAILNQPRAADFDRIEREQRQIVQELQSKHGFEYYPLSQWDVNVSRARQKFREALRTNQTLRIQWEQYQVMRSALKDVHSTVEKTPGTQEEHKTEYLLGQVEWNYLTAVFDSSLGQGSIRYERDIYAQTINELIDTLDRRMYLILCDDYIRYPLFSEMQKRDDINLYLKKVKKRNAQR